MGLMYKLSFYTVVLALLSSALVEIRTYMQGGICRSEARVDNKVVIITGANTGIGKETAIDLVKRGAKVIMTCRNNKRCETAAEDVLFQTGVSKQYIQTSQLDLGSIQSVRKFASDFKKKYNKLDILINNAGVMHTPYTLTDDGFEEQFGVNHLGHFLLTLLLTDTLIRAAPSRVVTLSSESHRMMAISSLNYNDLMPSEEYYSKLYAYSQSKLANILFSRELGKRLAGTGVTTYSVHPGFVHTELLRNYPIMTVAVTNKLFHILTWPIAKTPVYGAQTTICCAVDDALTNISGKYYADCGERNPIALAEDDDAAKKLWDISLNYLKIDHSEIPAILQ